MFGQPDLILIKMFVIHKTVKKGEVFMLDNDDFLELEKDIMLYEALSGDDDDYDDNERQTHQKSQSKNPSGCLIFLLLPAMIITAVIIAAKM